jgi:hypothetical protein
MGGKGHARGKVPGPVGFGDQASSFMRDLVASARKDVLWHIAELAGHADAMRDAATKSAKGVEVNVAGENYVSYLKAVLDDLRFILEQVAILDSGVGEAVTPMLKRVSMIPWERSISHD